MILTANVLLTHPATGERHLLRAGSPLPEWANGMVGDHVLRDGRGEDQPKPAEVPGPKPPRRSGPGSSAAAWRTYAAKHDVEVATDADRDDVIAALEEAGVPVD